MVRTIRVFLLLWLSVATLAPASTAVPDRRAQLIRGIHALKQLGFSVEKERDRPDVSRYLLRMDHPENLLHAAMGTWAYGAPVSPELTRLLEAVRGGRMALDVDWRRYLAHRPESVQAAWLGRDTNTTPPSVSTFLERKGIQFLLTFGAGDRLKQIQLKPIDARFRDGNDTARLHATDWRLSIRRSNPKNRYDTTLQLTGETFLFERRSGTGTKQQVELSHLMCDLDARHSYDGRLQCTLPTLSVIQGSDRITVKNVHIDQRSEVKGAAVDCGMTMGADTVHMEYRAPDTLQTLHIVSPRFEAWAHDLNVTLLEALEQRSLHPLPDNAAARRQERALIQKLISSGVKSGYAVTADRIGTRAVDPNEQTDLHVQKFSSRVSIVLGRRLAYHEHTTAGATRLEIRRNGAVPFAAQFNRVKYALAFDDVYNPFPDLIALPERLRAETNSSRDERWYLEELLGKVIHTGARAEIVPLKIGSVTLRNGQQHEVYSSTELNLHARFRSNTIDVRRSTAPVRMLGYLDLSGRWELKKSDFQQLIRHLSMQIRIMAMIFVRYEGDKAIFDLKLDHGHLRINGKQIL